MDRDRVDRAGGGRSAASLSAWCFDRCAGAGSEEFECQFTTTDAFYCQSAASINKRKWPLANLHEGKAATKLSTPSFISFDFGMCMIYCLKNKN